MVQLSEPTKVRIRALFPEGDVSEAEAVLVERCAESIPLWSERTPTGLERVRFAAIRFSGGELSRLHDGVRLAHEDWRDLLVAAGFADQVQGYLQWAPRRFEVGIATRWLNGERIQGVTFGNLEKVQVSRGLYRDNQGFPGPAAFVVALVGLEPSPRYRVQLEDGETADVPEAALRAAG